MTGLPTGHSAAYCRMLDFVSGIVTDEHSRAYREELTRLYEAIAEAEHTAGKMEEERDEAQDELGCAKDDLKQCEKAHDEARAEADKLKEKLEEFQDKFITLDKRLCENTPQARVIELENGALSYRRALDEAQSQLAETRDKLDATTVELGRAETRIAILEERLRELDIAPPPLLVHKSDPTDAGVMFKPAPFTDSIGVGTSSFVELSPTKVQQAPASLYPKVNSVAALKRLPVGTKLVVVRNGALAVSVPRVVRKVLKDSIEFTTERDTVSFLLLPKGTRVASTERGFTVTSPDHKVLEYVFGEKI